MVYGGGGSNRFGYSDVKRTPPHLIMVLHQSILSSMVLHTTLMVVTEELLNYSVMELQQELKCLDQRTFKLAVSNGITVDSNATDATDPFYTGNATLH